MIKKVKIKNLKGLKLSSILTYPDQNHRYPAVILLHGFTECKDEEHIVSLAQDLVEKRFVSIRFDCSGFGESEGSFTQDYRMSNYIEDIECIYDFLKKQRCVAVERIGVFGHSMGGGLGIVFGSRHPEIKAVCAVSPATHIQKVQTLKRWLREKCFFRKNTKYGLIELPYAFVEDAKKWNIEKAVEKVSSPLLIILGKKDSSVPPSDTRNLFKAANKPKKLIEIGDMGHDYKKDKNLIKIVNSKIIKFFEENM